jgi:hypothetical protein
MMNVSRKFLLILSLVLLAGCATNPPYRFSNDEKKALLKSKSDVSMCKDGKFYSLTTPKGADAIPIPAGGRITLGTPMHYSGYNVSYNCYPFLSFQAQEGGTYLIDSYVREKKCYIELVREDLSKESGVAFEPSIGSRDCFVTR